MQRRTGSSNTANSWRKIDSVEEGVHHAYFSTRRGDLATYVHGDDFVTSGEPCDLDWLKAGLSERYSIKTSVLGDGKGQCSEVRVLNRILQWHSGVGISYEADPRHVEFVTKGLGLGEEKGW